MVVVATPDAEVEVDGFGMVVTPLAMHAYSAGLYFHSHTALQDPLHGHAPSPFLAGGLGDEM